MLFQNFTKDVIYYFGITICTKPTTQPKIDRENFDWRWTTDLRLDVNGGSYIDLDYGDSYCVSLDSNVLGRTNGEWALHGKQVKGWHVFPLDDGKQKMTSFYRQLNQAGGYKYCDIWQNPDIFKFSSCMNF